MSNASARKLWLGSIGYRNCDPLCYIVSKSLESYEEAAREAIRQELKESEAPDEDAQSLAVYGPFEEEIETVREQVHESLLKEFEQWLKDDESADAFIFF
jgi:hypothetical protein